MKIPKSSKKTLELIAKFKLETILQEIVIGKILGDASIRKEGILNFTQSIKQKEYIEHCYNLFKNYTKSGIKLNLNKRNNKINEILYFETCAIFKEYLPFFYKQKEGSNARIKIIPSNIYELLTPRGLAYWIMDDGTYKGAVILCTHSFTEEEVLLLMNVLITKFNLDCKIRKIKIRDTGLFWSTILIKSNSTYKLWDLVGEYILPSMYYKFGKFAK